MADFQRNPLFRMQYEPAQECHVLLFPEGMIKLSDTAAEILAQFEGPTSLEGATSRLQEKYPEADLEGDVREFVEVAHEKQWLKRC